MSEKGIVRYEDDDEYYEFCIETRKELDAWEKRQREKELKEEGRQEGLEEGMQKGLEKGKQEGMSLMQEKVNKINKLNTCLIADQRFDDLSRSTSDPAYQEELFKEYHLE